MKLLEYTAQGLPIPAENCLTSEQSPPEPAQSGSGRSRVQAFLAEPMPVRDDGGADAAVRPPAGNAGKVTPALQDAIREWARTTEVGDDDTETLITMLDQMVRDGHGFISTVTTTPTTTDGTGVPRGPWDSTGAAERKAGDQTSRATGMQGRVVAEQETGREVVFEQTDEGLPYPAWRQENTPVVVAEEPTTVGGLQVPNW